MRDRDRKRCIKHRLSAAIPVRIADIEKTLDSVAQSAQETSPLFYGPMWAAFSGSKLRGSVFNRMRVTKPRPNNNGVAFFSLHYATDGWQSKTGGVMKRYARLALIAALSIVAIGQVSQILAANYSWNTSGGQWDVSVNWNPSTVPGPADAAWVVNGGTAIIGALQFESCNTLYVGGANTGNVLINSGFASLTVGSGGELVGYTGGGTLNQSAGTNTTASNGLVLGQTGAGNGTYILSGGSLYSNYITDGNFAIGTFNQTGGTDVHWHHVRGRERPRHRLVHPQRRRIPFCRVAPSTSAMEMRCSAGHSVKPAARTPPQLPFCWATSPAAMVRTALAGAGTFSPPPLSTPATFPAAAGRSRKAAARTLPLMVFIWVPTPAAPARTS